MSERASTKGRDDVLASASYPQETPRVAPLLKDGDVIERLKQFRMRWQESGDLTYLGKALVDAVVEIESYREALAGIRLYCNDTLSGRADGGPDDRAWQREAVVEVRNRARSALENRGQGRADATQNPLSEGRERS
jgi:hypothetical protein